MREILFKAKRKDTGEWVEGLLWKKKYNSNKIFISCFPDKDDNEEVFVVAQDTICQYTGLTDKNGRKIFEGDIVTTKYELGRGGFYTFEVYYNENLCQFALTINTGSYTKNKQYDWLQLTASKAKKIEVIGNVFDNPELLEKAR